MGVFVLLYCGIFNAGGGLGFGEELEAESWEGFYCFAGRVPQASWRTGCLEPTPLTELQ